MRQCSTRFGQLFQQPNVRLPWGGTGLPGWENTWNGPDGFGGSSNYNSVDGIAGLLMPVKMALVGVFLDDFEPAGTAPARLDFNGGINFSVLSPGLSQVFFIGDGRTDQNVLQTFFAPTGATRLFLGIADASSHLGDVGFYFDNQGEFTVNMVDAVPEPTSIAIWGIGAIGLMFARRKRQQKKLAA